MISEPTLVIGDKNLSSWSLRPWLALRHAGIRFREQLVRLDRPDTDAQILRCSPSGKVPVLVDGDVRIWESLAICEWAAERVPALWPRDAAPRAHARSVSAEMHAGFAALRSEMPLNVRARTPKTPSRDAREDIDRILAIWRECLDRPGRDGDYLFGAFSIADCMFAPVVSRFVTYAVTLDEPCARYAAAVAAHPAMIEWAEAARRE